MKLTQVIINNWITPQTCPDGIGLAPSNQSRKSKDQDAKSPGKEEIEGNNKPGQLFGNICLGGIAIAFLTAVILIMRFIVMKEYNRGMLFEMKYMLYIWLSGFIIFLVALPYVLPLAVLIAGVFNGLKMHRDNNWVKDFDASKKTGDLTCLVIDRIEDPDNTEVWKAILNLRSAGITVRLVTGVDAYTARSTAIKCGIIRPDEDFLVLDGKVFNKWIRDSAGNVKQELFDKVWPRLRVLSASTPNDKYLLVKHIMESKLNLIGEVVAVTGQGCDDIPALQKADIGFALGIAGTDAAKEASDIILTNDNTSSIVKAVMWGRNANESIAKFLQFQLCINLVVVIVEVVCACAIMDSPFSANHLFWIYLFVCSLASLALCTEMPDPAILERQPYGRKKELLSGIMLRNIIGQAVYQLVIIFILLFAGAEIFQINSVSKTVNPLPTQPYYGSKAENIWKSEHYSISKTQNLLPTQPYFGSKAERLLPSEDYSDTKAERPLPTQHFTIIFNTFSLMTLFNGLNARLIHRQRNIFEGLFTNPIFCGTFIFIATAQIVIVQFGGMHFDTVPLTYYQWMWCLFFGVSVLLWGQVLALIKHWCLLVSPALP